MPGKQDRSQYLHTRISPTARWLLEELQEHLGLSQASVIEMLLREESRRRGITIPGSGTDRQRRIAEADELSRLSMLTDPKKG